MWSWRFPRSGCGCRAGRFAGFVLIVPEFPGCLAGLGGVFRGGAGFAMLLTEPGCGMRGDGAGVCRVPGRAAYKKTPVTAGLTGVFSGLRRVQGHDGVFRANVLFFLRFVTVDTFDTFSRRCGVDGADGGKFAGSLRVMFGAAVAARDDRGDSAVSRGRADAWGAGCSRGMCRVSCTGGLPGWRMGVAGMKNARDGGCRCLRAFFQSGKGMG